jgi:hypothetical protein
MYIVILYIVNNPIKIEIVNIVNEKKLSKR